MSSVPGRRPPNGLGPGETANLGPLRRCGAWFSGPPPRPWEPNSSGRLRHTGLHSTSPHRPVVAEARRAVGVCFDLCTRPTSCLHRPSTRWTSTAARVMISRSRSLPLRGVLSGDFPFDSGRPFPPPPILGSMETSRVELRGPKGERRV